MAKSVCRRRYRFSSAKPWSGGDIDILVIIAGYAGEPAVSVKVGDHFSCEYLYTIVALIQPHVGHIQVVGECLSDLKLLAGVADFKLGRLQYVEARLSGALYRFGAK